ncbi:MAG: hypothetical protein ACPHER_08785 [Nevskiales bacterium]
MSNSKRHRYPLLTWLASWGLALEGISLARAYDNEVLNDVYLD